MWFLIFLLISIVIIIFGKHLHQKLMIKCWRRTLNLEQHFSVFQEIYTHVNGFALSQQERASNDAFEYVYGEIEFESFIALLSLCKPNSSTVFYDLGSGTGKAVIACAMVFNVFKSCGIELFSSLYQSSILQQQRLRERPGYQHQADSISFINADFLTTKLNDASLVFINATSFLGETWEAISRHLDDLQTNALVITTSKPLRSPCFITIQKTTISTSWGLVSAFIQRRIA